MICFVIFFIFFIDGILIDIFIKELCGGVWIYYIFNFVFGSFFELIDFILNFIVFDIRIVIRNLIGFCFSFFVFEMVFDFFVKL